MVDQVRVRRALISVSDKTGLLELGSALADLGVEMVSTGGTAAALGEGGFKIFPVDRVTGFPEIMDGRVKTLHPAVHGALLAVRDKPEHVAAMDTHGIRPIDLVCVNLYPFERTIAKAGVSREEAIENIDIGGPSMIRSGAKNHAYVAVVTDPSEYEELIRELRSTGGFTSLVTRRLLATRAYARTAAYDGSITAYLAQDAVPTEPEAIPARLSILVERAEVLRYGENSHQAAGLFREVGGGSAPRGSIMTARKLHGKGLSYNNIGDASAALELVRAFVGVDPARAGACVVKHMNPCGAALDESCVGAVSEAIAGDPLAAYGGILAVNRAMDGATATRLCEKDVFMEVIVAPSYEPEALEMLRARWNNLRLLEVGAIVPSVERELEFRNLPGAGGGVLVQERDAHLCPGSGYERKSGGVPSDETIRAARFLECVVRSLLSNAVCIGGVSGGTGSKTARLYGAGAGQMDRVTSCRLACEKAGKRAEGAIAFSDAFFPFPDGPRILVDAGVRTIVHPGGSKRDGETFELCERAGVTCLVTGVRHFRH